MLQSENFINPAEIFRLEAAHCLRGVAGSSSALPATPLHLKKQSGALGLHNSEVSSIEMIVPILPQLVEAPSENGRRQPESYAAASRTRQGPHITGNKNPIVPGSELPQSPQYPLWD